MLDTFPQLGARLLILEDAGAVAREAAQRIVREAGHAIEAGALFHIALSGGSTPLDTYRLLASDDALRCSVHWPSVRFFWGDERFVPVDHADSNYGAVRGTLLDALDLTPDQVHPVPTDRPDAGAAARDYEKTLRRVFARPEGVPRFELVLAGLGTDGHTASLFPGALPAEDGALVAAVARPRDDTPRITLALEVLNAAHQVLFLVTGEDKAKILERVLSAREPDPSLPATLVRPTDGTVSWLVDRAAASRIIEAAQGGEEGTG